MKALKTVLIAALVLVVGACSSTNHPQVKGTPPDAGTSVGYGQKDGNHTGSATTVDVDNPALSLTAYFRQVPGVRVREVGGLTQVMIRSAVQDQMNPEPLYVLDDVPLGRSFQQLEQMVDVNDVRRVTVLRDISSANIYGMNAKNGVILVETKKENTPKKTKRPKQSN